VFRVGALPGEARDEPRILPDPDISGQSRLSAAAIPAVHDFVAGRCEPLPAAATAAAAPPPEREPPVVSRQRRRPFGPIGSLVLHLLPLLLLLNWPLRPPPETPPIPVRLVFQPPPPPPKPIPPKPLPRPEVRPPPGRLASEDIGDIKEQGRDREKSDAAASAEKPPAAPEQPPAPEQKTAAIVPPPPVTKSPGLPDQALAQAPPRPKPKPAIPPPLLRRTVARLHAAPRPARFPGPAATRDEYLAYLVYLTRKHLNLLPLSVVGGRNGETVVDILVLDDGRLARVMVGQSSGYPDIDRRVEAMIQAVGRFPPLPQWFQGPSMQLEFRLYFPQALEN
jgi:periplasmic protein TonB